MSIIKTETAVGLCIVIAVAIFFYMTFQIGVFRFDGGRYASYTIYFNDVSGLKKKDDVKIAGVKVGWVDGIHFISGRRQVLTTIMILKEYQLHADAYGMVRQDGFLGGKHLELVPGSPTAAMLSSGSELTQVGRDAVSMDGLLEQVKTIATHVEEVTRSLRETFGGEQGAQMLKDTVKTVNEVAHNLEKVTATLEKIMERNESSVDGIVRDVGALAGSLKDQVPALVSEVKDLATRLSQSIAPALEAGINCVSKSVDQNLTSAAETFKSVGGQINEVAQKINNGTGILGELINDSETSKDLKSTVQSLKTMFARMDKMSVMFDPHFESMLQHNKQVPFKDAKGYFDVRLYPQEDYFYLVGLVGRQSGRIKRFEEYSKWFTSHDCPLNPEKMDLSNADKLRYAPIKYQAVREFDHWLWNLQFGKVYGNLALRFGLFESTAGFGFDYDVPFRNDWFRWITTFEFYDFRGRLRYEDNRPHLKWLNRIFISKYLYFVAGFDDFVSRTNSSAFVGAGLRFDDDDVKYLLAKANLTVG